MTQAELPTYIVAMPHRIYTDEGTKLTFEFLSERGKGIDPLSAIEGLREWLPILDENVEGWDTRYDADLARRTWGGFVVRREQMERLVETENCVMRLDPSSTATLSSMGLEL